MYLKRLEILGFKSFADKTELEFGPGITAVVGPNGSGKSNVSDAVRWVLGEQSARALRGGNMADVIFAGSEGKKAMGFAQVSLVLDNSDNKLNVGFIEVMITRRVDRSGEGEYFINQVPCRLKDVHDLFLDTGIGKDNYSIIGQGKIDEILSSKPEDRRALFEEAAGISRYKARKREAHRRLEETEQNLLRITDIIGELSTQMDSLADQAQRAETYTTLNTELTGLDIGLLAHALAAVARRLERQVDDNAQLSDNLRDIDARLHDGEQAVDVARTLVESLDQELGVVAGQVTEAAGRVERVEGHLALATQEQRSAQTEGERLDLELGALEDKLRSLAAELTDMESSVGSLQAELTTAAADLAAKEQVHTTAQAALVSAHRTVEDRKDRILTLLQAEAEQKNIAIAADRNGEDSSRRMARLDAERSKAESEGVAVSTASAELEARKTGLLADRERTATTLATLRIKRSEADSRLQELQQQGATTREAIQGASSRLEAIEDLMNAFDGYQKGTKTVLQGREKGLPFASDVQGAVAELVRAQARFEKAIEVTLGGNIQNIVTATDDGAKRAIEHLKRTNGGRATFLPLNAIRHNGFRPDEEKEFRSAAGILGVALELVRYEDRFRPAIASLLGRVLIATDMDAALAFGRKTGMRYRIVTLDGELLAAGGALTGGSTGSQGNGLLSREREREELGAKIANLRNTLTSLRKAHADAEAERASIDRQVQETESALRQVETLVAQADQNGARLAAEARRWSDLLQTYATEASLIHEDARDGSERAETARRALAELTVERQQLEAEVDQLSADGAAQVGVLEEQAKALTAVQVRLAELNQELRGLSGQGNRLQTEQRALEADRTAKQQQRELTVVRLERATSDMDTARTELEAAGAARRHYEGAQARLQARKLAALEQSNNREREMRTLRRTHGESQGKLQQGEVEEARLRLEQEGLCTRLQEQHGLGPADITGRALPDDQVVDARERTHALREHIRDLGPVNLQAIEEYRTAQERFQFLEQQRTDLEEAKGSLYRAVEELDKRIKTHFLESFQVIRREFQGVYQELFEGGRADLQLVDEADLLETGVEIMAQPPGKKPQTLSLLSGGERALTAIALLFALLRVKPTPFVILDEVEAALDEANVERFGKYLRVFAGQSCQFICISHQRGTMEVADALYGVTMEGTGVSKVVSVRLVDLEREAS